MSAIHTLDPATRLQGSDALHLMRDPDDPARQDLRLAGSALLGLFYERQAADYVLCDKATAGRCIHQTPGAVGNMAGSDATLLIEFNCPSAAVASAQVVSALASALSAPTSLHHSFCVRLETNDDLVLYQRGADYATDQRTRTLTDFRVTYSGQSIRLAIALSGNSATDPTVVCNGADITAKFEATTTAGDAPNWFDAGMVNTKHFSGWHWLGDIFPRLRIINAQLTIAEAKAWTAGGRLPLRASVAGSMVSILANGDAETGTAGGWSAYQATISVTTSSPQEGAYAFRMIPGSGIGAGAALVSGSQMERGRTYRITGYARGDGSIRPELNLQATGLIWQGTTSPAWQGIDFVYTPPAAGSLQLRHGAAPGDGVRYVDFDALKVTPLGLTSDPQVQPCQALHDPLNDLDAVIVGGTPVTRKTVWTIAAQIDASATGNKQLLNADVFAYPDRQVIDRITTRGNGAPTLSVGDSITTTKFSASTALTTARTEIAVTNRFPDAARKGLYANVTIAGGTERKLTIRGHAAQA